MRHSIPEDIASLDIESIDFNNRDLLKSLILKLLDTIEQLATDVLPPDAEFKGYRSVIKQNIKFKTDNVQLVHMTPRFMCSMIIRVHHWWSIWTMYT